MFWVELISAAAPQLAVEEGEATTWNVLRDAKKRGKTVMLVSHRPSELVGFDFVVVMLGGKLARFGPVKEILPTITTPAAAS